MTVLVTVVWHDGRRHESRFDSRESARAYAVTAICEFTERDEHGVLVLTPTCTRVTVEVEAE